MGRTQFELQSVWKCKDHEIFGKWVVLIDEEQGVTAQGFLKLSILVLKGVEQSRIHESGDLDADGDDTSLVVGLPTMEQLEPYLLIFRFSSAQPQYALFAMLILSS